MSDEKKYTLAKGKAVTTKAGVKTYGDEVTPKMIGKNFDRLLELRTIIEMPEATEPEPDVQTVDLSSGTEETTPVQNGDATAETETDTEEVTAETLEKLNKAELLETYKELDLEVTMDNTKPKIIDAILAALQNGDVTEPTEPVGEGAQRTEG